MSGDGKPVLTERQPMRALRSDEVAASIADLIVDRQLDSGASLPTETQLVADLGASRNSVREAIRTLQAQGIVSVRHGYGTFVGEAGVGVLEPWLTFRTRARSDADVSRLRELLEVRQIIEIDLCQRVSVAPDEELLAELEECVRVMGGGGSGATEADRRFHDIICRATGLALAGELVDLFWTVFQKAEAGLGGRRPSARATAARHQVVLDAIRSGDPDGVRDAVVRHFDGVRSRVSATRP